MFKFSSAFQIVMPLFIFSYQYSFSQSQRNSVESELIDLFNRKLATQNRLLNGVAYVDYAGKLEGNAYLDDNIDFFKSTLVYDGIEFSDVPIIYDLVQDKVVTLLPNGYTKYSLLNERLSSFVIKDAKFIYFAPSIDTISSRNSGFYKLAYKGPASVLVKYAKSVKEIVDLYGARKKFTLRVDHYILLDDKLLRLSRDSDIYRVLNVDKGDLKKHLKSKNLKFKKEPEQTLVEAVSFYEQRLK